MGGDDNTRAPFFTSLNNALGRLDPLDDAHWTKAGAPDLNVLKEYMGQKVTRKDVKNARSKFDRETAIMAIPVDPGTAHPERMPDDTGAGKEQLVRMPGSISRVASDPIDMFEEMLENTPTQYRRFNPMFNQALQSYESNRPGILEQRERNKARGRA